MRKLAMTLFALVLVASMATVSFAAAPQAAPSPGNLQQFGQANPSGTRHDSKPTQGQIILEQLPNQLNGLFADSGCELCPTGAQSIADNFTLEAPYTIEQIQFWTGYYPTDVPLNPDMITVIFHQDAAGLPGAVVYNESPIAYTRAQTGVVLFGVHEYLHTLTLGTPLTLAPGAYWLEIFNNSSPTDGMEFFWETGNADSYGRGGYDSAFATETPGVTWYTPIGYDMAFRLIAALPGTPAHLNKTKINWAPAARPGYYKVVFSARIWDNLSQPAVGTTVYGTWTYPDNSTHDKTYVTDAAGRAKFPIKETMTGTYTFCVTDISGNGYVYDPGANTAPDCLSATVTAP